VAGIFLRFLLLLYGACENLFIGVGVGGVPSVEVVQVLLIVGAKVR
jgi:hypothetical protein